MASQFFFCCWPKINNVRTIKLILIRRANNDLNQGLGDLYCFVICMQNGYITAAFVYL